jgi:hypothetical protein
MIFRLVIHFAILAPHHLITHEKVVHSCKRFFRPCDFGMVVFLDMVAGFFDFDSSIDLPGHSRHGPNQAIDKKELSFAWKT